VQQLPEPPSSAAPIPETTTEYEAGLTVIGEFDTVEQFCRYFNWLKPPSMLEKNSNYHLFKSGIKPMWEDEANANGGKWVLTMKNNPALLDRCWQWLAMALVGQDLEDGDEICGVVVSLRSKVDRIQLWTRSKDDIERLNAIGKKLVAKLDVSEADGIGLEFQYNTDDRPPPNKFLSIQALPNTSYRSSFQQTPGGSTPTSATPMGGGAFGAFGMGIGGTNWKGVKRA
jgi:translation initiation factor 4E